MCGCIAPPIGGLARAPGWAWPENRVSKPRGWAGLPAWGQGTGRAGRDGTVWLTSTQTATMLGITRQTLLDWWTKWKKGPPFIRPGVRGDRRYRLEDVEAFLRVNH